MKKLRTRNLRSRVSNGASNLDAPPSLRVPDCGASQPARIRHHETVSRRSCASTRNHNRPRRHRGYRGRRARREREDDDHDERVDVGLSADHEARQNVRRRTGPGKGKVGFVVQQGGSDTGITDVSRGRVSIGNASRAQQPSDPGGLVFNKIAYDAVCIITNPGNPLGTLSQEQVAVDLHRPHPLLEPGPGREGDRLDRARLAYRHLGHRGRLQRDLPRRQAVDRGVGPGEVVQRPRQAVGRGVEEARSASSRSTSSTPACGRSTTRASAAPCATPSPASTRASVPSRS